eukprot:gene7683-9190_t
MKLYSDRIALPSFRRSLIGAAALALCSGSAFAINPFVVKDIRVEGIQRTEAGTVFSYLPVRVGETFDDKKSVAAIKGLYGSGIFKDVRLEQDGDVLVVIVEERPAIAKVDFTGTKEFEKDMLVKALKDIGVGETKTFDKASVYQLNQPPVFSARFSRSSLSEKALLPTRLICLILAISPSSTANTMFTRLRSIGVTVVVTFTATQRQLDRKGHVGAGRFHAQLRKQARQMRISGVVIDQEAGVDAVRDAVQRDVHRVAVATEPAAALVQRNVLAQQPVVVH